MRFVNLKNLHRFSFYLVSFLIPGLCLAESYPVFAFWNQGKVILAATSLDGSLVKIIDSESSPQESLPLLRFFAATSENKKSLAYQLREQNKLQLYDGESKKIVTITPSAQVVVKVPGEDNVLFSVLGPASAPVPMSSLPPTSWKLVNLVSGETTAVTISPDNLLMSSGALDHKVVSMKLNLNSPSPEEPPYKAVIVDAHTGKESEIEGDPQDNLLTKKLGRSSKRISLSNQCVVDIRKEGEIKRKFSLRTDDLSCDSLLPISDTNIVFAGASRERSSYGSVYSVRGFNVNTLEVSTLVQGDSKTLFKPIGVFNDSYLLILSHGLERKPSYIVEVSDLNGQNRKSLIGSELPIEYAGALELDRSDLVSSNADLNFYNAKQLATTPETDDEEISKAVAAVNNQYFDINSEETYALTLKALQSKDRNTRQRIAGLVSGFSEEQSIKLFEILLRDEDATVISYTLGSLINFKGDGKPLVPRLIEIAKSNSAVFSVSAALAAARIDPSLATAEVLPIIADDLKKARGYSNNASIKTLGSYGPLAKPYSEVLLKYLEQLKELKNCQDLDSMFEPDVLTAARKIESDILKDGLRKYADRNLKLITSCLKYDPNNFTYRDITAAKYLGGLGSLANPALSTLAEELRVIDTQMLGYFRQQQMLEALDEIGTPEAQKVKKDFTEELIKNSQSKDDKVRLASIQQLELCKQAASKAVPSLLPLLKYTSNYETVSPDAVARTLGEIAIGSQQHLIAKAAREHPSETILDALIKLPKKKEDIDLYLLYLRRDPKLESPVRYVLSSFTTVEEKKLILARYPKYNPTAGYTDSAENVAENLESWVSRAKSEPEKFPLMTRLLRTLDTGESLVHSREATHTFNRLGFISGVNGVKVLFDDIESTLKNDISGGLNQGADTALTFRYLGEAGRSAIPKLITFLNSKDDSRKYVGVSGLAAFIDIDPQAKAAFEKAIDSGDWILKSQAERLLKLKRPRLETIKK